MRLRSQGQRNYSNELPGIISGFSWYFPLNGPDSIRFRRTPSGGGRVALADLPPGGSPSRRLFYIPLGGRDPLRALLFVDRRFFPCRRAHRREVESEVERATHILLDIGTRSREMCEYLS